MFRLSVEGGRADEDQEGTTVVACCAGTGWVFDREGHVTASLATWAAGRGQIEVWLLECLTPTSLEDAVGMLRTLLSLASRRSIDIGSIRVGKQRVGDAIACSRHFSTDQTGQCQHVNSYSRAQLQHTRRSMRYRSLQRCKCDRSHYGSAPKICPGEYQPGGSLRHQKNSRPAQDKQIPAQAASLPGQAYRPTLARPSRHPRRLSHRQNSIISTSSRRRPSGLPLTPLARDVLRGGSRGCRSRKVSATSPASPIQPSRPRPLKRPVLARSA